MSRADVRQALADAVSAVAGITGHVVKPSALNEGDAWPQWRGAGRDGGGPFEDTWAVLIVLPQADDVTADAYADARQDALVDALLPVMWVDAVQPANIGAEGAPMYALIISGRCEI